MEARLAHLLRARGRASASPRRSRGRAGHRRGAVRLAAWSCRAAFARRERASATGRTRLAAAHAIEEVDAALAGPGAEGVQEAAAARGALAAPRRAASRSSVSGIMLAEQTLLNAAVLTVDATSRNRALAGHRLQRAADRARAAAALPGDPDLAAAAPDRPGGDRGPRRVRARDPRDRAGDRGLRAARRARAAGGRPVRDEPRLFGQRLRLQPLRPGARSALGMGLHLVSGALNQAALARDRARAAAACWLLAAARVRRLDADPGDLRPGAARRGRLRRRDGAAGARCSRCSTAAARGARVGAAREPAAQPRRASARSPR